MKNLHKMTLLEDDIEPSVKTTRDGSLYNVKSLADVYTMGRMVSVEPFTYINTSKYPKWVEVMDAEMGMIKKNGT